MSQRLRYTDAVKILGGSGPAVGALDALLGGALSVATAGGSDAALNLFDAKAEMIRLGRLAAGAVHDRVRGVGRFDRSRRLQAAHGILVVTAFFEAFDEIVTAADFPAPELTRDDQVRLAAGTRVEADWLHRLLDAPLPVPSADRTYRDLLDDLAAWYADAGARFGESLRGLAEWDRADENARIVLARLTGERLPAVAVRRYEEAHRRLAVDIPEFAVWVDRTETQAIGRGLLALETTLRRVSSGRDPQRHRAALAAAYRADLDRPILGGDAGELTMPLLGEAYVDHRFRVKQGGPGARTAEEEWWDTQPRDDLAAFLTRYLTTPQAAGAPLLLLGHPGAGKSALTRILAARLPAADFLAVRVVLREVPAEAEIQDQIEHALRAAIGESVAWAELAGAADGALPVVLLDGFDELLQATGIHQSDYLHRVAEFQRREAVQGRPVAVVVTSRLAVADRARLPADGLAVRLEPFDEAQVARWLATWAEVNGAALARRGLRPLPPEVASTFAGLAGQPLLLLMLALYDATANALQRAGDSLDGPQLYERLLREFAAREVRRLHPGAPGHDLPALIEAELMRLAFVAFAMFNRARQWVTEQELDHDLAALGIKPSRPGRTEGFRSPLTAGQEMVGRFFFIQRSQAVRDGRTLQTYEFLHATFGEYLVARLVVNVLQDTAARASAGTLPLLSGTGDDLLLKSLLGYTPLVSRHTVVPFLARRLDGPAGAPVRAWLMSALRAALDRPQYGELAYRPVEKPADEWMATYSFNLMLLALACGGPVRASDVFPDADDPAARMRRVAARWAAATDGITWGGMLDAMTVRHGWAGDRRDLVLEFGAGDAPDEVDPFWIFGRGPGTERPEPGVTLRYYARQRHVSKSLHLTGAMGDDMMRHALEPLIGRTGESATTFVVHPDGDVESVARSLLTVWTVSAADGRGDALPRAYRRAAFAVARSEPSDLTPNARLLLRMLAADAARLPADDVLLCLRTIVGSRFYDAALAPHVLDCLAAMPAVDDHAAREIGVRAHG